MRKPMLAGNWKMYLTPEKGAELAKALAALVADTKGREIVVCTPATHLDAVGRVLKGSNVSLGAQNMYPMAEGAYTGEISPAMLKSLGVTHVVLGHSERRQYFFESDGFINAKIKSALENGLTPIACCGESLDERERKLTFDKIGYQIDHIIEGIAPEKIPAIVIAYEPIWAIGTGRTATNEQAQEVHAFIRGKLTSRFGAEIANAVRILYGGSVKPENVDGLMAMPDIDGALVGGASLKAEGFARIANFVA